MKCEDVLPLLRNYADRELDPADVERIGTHIAKCSECAERLEAERELKLAIRSKVRMGPAPAGLAAEIKRVVRARAGLAANPSHERGWWLRSPRFFKVGMAACLLLMVFTGIWIGSSLMHSPDSQMPTSRLAVELVDDHIHYLTAEGANQVESDDPAEAERWFSGRLDISVNLPRFREPSVALRGGRLCYVLKRRVALLFYERGGEKLSLFVMNPSGLDLPDMGRGDSNAIKFVTESLKGYNVLCWKRNGLLYALVGKGGLEALVDGAY